MSNVSHEKAADAVSDLAISCVVEVARVATCPAEQDIWAELLDCGIESVHVDEACLLVDIVRSGLEIMAACGDFLCLGLMTMSQVTSMSQREAHNSTTWWNQAGVDSEVGRTS